MKRKTEFCFVVAFVVINLLAPLVIGEKYPFTISPMFCDQPEQYVTYEVYDPAGEPLDAESFGLHLVYDGNPPGFGMGIKPTPTLHEFGEMVDEVTVRNRVQAALNDNDELRELPFVIVKRHHVCCRGNCLSRIDDQIQVERQSVKRRTQGP